MEKEDLVKIIAKIKRKECFETRVGFVSHDEDHSNQGVVVYQRRTRFELLVLEGERELGYSKYSLDNPCIDFVLEADGSEWGDIPDQKLVARYKELVKKFDSECDKYHPDDTIEIIYSKEKRLNRRKNESEKGISSKTQFFPPEYQPLGFETYTCEYSRRGEVPPEVVSVKPVSDKT